MFSLANKFGVFCGAEGLQGKYIIRNKGKERASFHFLMWCHWFIGNLFRTVFGKNTTKCCNCNHQCVLQDPWRPCQHLLTWPCTLQFSYTWIFPQEQGRCGVGSLLCRAVSQKGEPRKLENLSLSRKSWGKEEGGRESWKLCRKLQIYFAFGMVVEDSGGIAWSSWTYQSRKYPSIPLTGVESIPALNDTVWIRVECFLNLI